MNKSTATNVNTPAINTAESDLIRTLQSDNCPSLSERSTLTFCVGCNDKLELLIRVCGNTGSGFFNDEWVSLQDVLDAVDAVPAGMPITSSTFRSIYAGKSNNSSGFLLAVLKHLGLATAHTDRLRGYVFLDSAGFIAEMGLLMAELPALEVIKKPVKAKSKRGTDAMVDVSAGVDADADVANA